MDVSTTQDVCFGLFAPGQWFICRMNPESPIVYRIGGTYPGVEDLFICETWSMNESRDGWIFSATEFGGGVQIPACNLEKMERVPKLKARHSSEQELRQRDEDWRKQWNSTREPIKVVRCTCGVGDEAERTRHTMHCFCRGEFN